MHKLSNCVSVVILLSLETPSTTDVDMFDVENLLFAFIHHHENIYEKETLFRGY